MNAIIRRIARSVALLCAMCLLNNPSAPVATAATANGVSTVTQDLVVNKVPGGVKLSYLDGTPVPFPGGSSTANQVIFLNRPQGTDTGYCPTVGLCVTNTEYCTMSNCQPVYFQASNTSGAADIYSDTPGLQSYHIVHGYYDNLGGQFVLDLAGLPPQPTQVIFYLSTYGGTGSDAVNVSESGSDTIQTATSLAGQGNLVGFTTNGSTSITTYISTQSHYVSSVFIVKGSAPTAAPYSRLRVSTRAGIHRLTWHSSTPLLGFNIVSDGIRLNRHLVTGYHGSYRFTTRHALGHLRLEAVHARG